MFLLGTYGGPEGPSIFAIFRSKLETVVTNVIVVTGGTIVTDVTGRLVGL